VSQPSYAHSDALIEDWCANRLWAWLNNRLWLNISLRLVDAEVRAGGSHSLAKACALWRC
jgi:hypothetical protein